MTTESFFEKFDQFADAPNAVPRMRELVLELAMQGKLVDQNGSDGSAIVLLEQIIRNYQLVTRRRGAKRADRDADIEAPNSLPGNWTWTTLGTIAEWGSGSTPPRGNHELYGGKLTWLKSGELNDNRSLVGSEERITEAALEAGSFRLNQSGDVLFAMYGATVGKAAILAEAAVTNQAVCGCTPTDGVSNQFLFYYLVSERPRFRNASEGGAQPNFSKDKILTYPFPLPPLAEQKRIVAKVDELMALCDRLEAQQNERTEKHAALARASLARFAQAPTPDNLQFLFHHAYPIPPADLRKSILTLAVQGKLVPQDPDDEPATKSMKNLDAAKPSIGSETNDTPFSPPDGWIWTRVASLFEVAGGIQKTPLRTPKNNAFPYLGVGNVYRGRLDLTNVKKFELEPGELDRRRLKPGDILIIEGNGSFTEIGRCAKWRGEIKDCVHQNHVIRCRPVDDRISDFVILFLNSPNGTEIMQRMAITSSGLFSLSVGKIRDIIVPIPPLAEQRRIVAKVDQLMALVDQLEAQRAAARTLGTLLTQALVVQLTANSPPNPPPFSSSPPPSSSCAAARPNPAPFVTIQNI